MFYDPRGHVVRTVSSDGSEQRVIYGVPVDLTKPDEFAPTPWEAFTYDANDNAGRTHPTATINHQHHWNTPTSIVIDALGRTIESISRNRMKLPDGSLSAIEEFRTQSTYDIRGNLLTVTDALGRVAFKHIYDLANKPLRIESIDTGLRQTVLDAAGNAIEGRDSKGALVLHAYDVLNRPIRLWARDDSNAAVTLRERLEYGDGSDPNQPATERNTNRTANRLGKLYRHYDEAGLLTFETYDFKGNVIEKVRQVISDTAILKVFDPPPPNWQLPAFRVDWQMLNARTILDPTEYRTTTSYDGLNRIKALQYPQDVEGKNKELRPHYNRAAALERVELDGAVYVDHIAYNAKGQRTLIAYGNSVMTRYAYDLQTFRLVRMRTERYTKADSLTYRPTRVALQDFGYEYDLAGNILTIHDRTPGSGVPNSPLGTEALDRSFDYDPLYRLLSATGRECNTPLPPAPWDDTPRCQDVSLTRAYSEAYTYDVVGSMTQLRHQAGTASFTRDLALVPNNNRLATVTIGATVYDYGYDDNGNLIHESTSHHFEWDHVDRMKAYRTQTGNSEPSVHTYYLYDAAGQRVKKLVRKQGGEYDVTIYIDGIFEHHRRVQGGTTQENNTLHVMDNQSRLALVRVGASFPEDTAPTIKYHLGDHLGSSNVVIDATGAWINREEFTPYSETSFGSFARKRYRFTGKERDEESGLYYHGARYYAPWMARWVSCDPKGPEDGLNLYVYAFGNPLLFRDLTGLQNESIEKSTASSPNVSATGNEFGPGFQSAGQAFRTGREGIRFESIPRGINNEALGGTLHLWSGEKGKWDSIFAARSGGASPTWTYPLTSRQN